MKQDPKGVISKVRKSMKSDEWEHDYRKVLGVIRDDEAYFVEPLVRGMDSFWPRTLAEAYS